LEDDHEESDQETGAPHWRLPRCVELGVTSVLIYDEHCGWSPSLNASKGTGGTEVHLVQVAEGLARAGCRVEAYCHDGQGQAENGVTYSDSRCWDRRPYRWSGLGEFEPDPVHVLLTVRKSAIPTTFTPGRIFTLVTDDPRGEEHLYRHLLGRSTLVCVSEWQAGLYRAAGHECVVIPAMLRDDLAPATARLPKMFCCVSAWNKGTDRLLEEWPAISKMVPEYSLAIGSPYSEPDDADDRCHAAGATWVGRLNPDGIVDMLEQSAAHVRIATIEETFGATDAIARAVGTRVHVWCPNGFGALNETVPGGAWRTKEGWIDAIRSESDPWPAKDFRVSTIMPQWLELLGVK
jgi:hypothetical protein